MKILHDTGSRVIKEIHQKRTVIIRYPVVVL